MGGGPAGEFELVSGGEGIWQGLGEVEGHTGLAPRELRGARPAQGPHLPRVLEEQPPLLLAVLVPLLQVTDVGLHQAGHGPGRERLHCAGPGEIGEGHSPAGQADRAVGVAPDRVGQARREVLRLVGGDLLLGHRDPDALAMDAEGPLEDGNLCSRRRVALLAGGRVEAVAGCRPRRQEEVGVLARRPELEGAELSQGLRDLRGATSSIEAKQPPGLLARPIVDADVDVAELDHRAVEEADCHLEAGPVAEDLVDGSDLGAAAPEERIEGVGPARAPRCDGDQAIALEEGVLAGLRAEVQLRDALRERPIVDQGLQPDREGAGRQDMTRVHDVPSWTTHRTTLGCRAPTRIQNPGAASDRGTAAVPSNSTNGASPSGPAASARR